MKVTKRSYKLPFITEWETTAFYPDTATLLRIIKIKNQKMKQFVYRIL